MEEGLCFHCGFLGDMGKVIAMHMPPTRLFGGYREPDQLLRPTIFKRA